MAPNEIIADFPRHFNKFDMKSYMQALYNVRITNVKTVVLPRQKIAHANPGRFRRHPSVSVYVWTSMKKRAYMTVDPEDVQGFQFPPPPSTGLQRQKNEEEKKTKLLEKAKLDRELWDTKFEKILEERYAGVKERPEEPMCEALAEGLSKLDLDEAALINRSTERRLYPETVKVSKRELARRKVLAMKMEAREKRRQSYRQMVDLFDSLLAVPATEKKSDELQKVLTSSESSASSSELNA